MTQRGITSLVLLAAVTTFAPRSSRAQQPTPPNTPATTGDSLPVFDRLNGALLRPGTLTYRLQSRRDTLVTPLGTRTVAVAETALDGTPTWLIAESRIGTVVETSDSLYLTRADLAPERWVASIGRTQLAASFTRDTMFAAMQTYQGRASFAVAVPPGVLLTSGMVDRIVELLPLQAGYHTAATLLLLELGLPRTQPARIAVEREESCGLPDRPGDCWVVVLRAGAGEQRLWVTTQAPRVVKTEQATSVGLLTSVLTQEILPPPPTVVATVPSQAAPPAARYPPRCPPPCGR